MKMFKDLVPWMPVFFMAGFIVMNIVLLVGELVGVIIQMVL